MVTVTANNKVSYEIPKGPTTFLRSVELFAGQSDTMTELEYLAAESTLAALAAGGQISFTAPLANPLEYQTAVVTLTAAQVIALDGSPITVVPAVAGQIIQVSMTKLVYTKGSAAFTVGSGKYLQMAYANGVLINEVLDAGFIDQSSSKEADLPGAGAGGVGIRGSAVQITSNDSSIAVGTGSTLTVTVNYKLSN
jgi:hypothetical protein